MLNLAQILLKLCRRAGRLEVELGVAERRRKWRRHVVSEATQEREENCAGGAEVGGIHNLSILPEVDFTCSATNLQVSLPGLKKDSAGRRI